MAKYIPRTEDIQAVQWTGENLEEVKEFFGENFTRALLSKEIEYSGHFGSLYIDLEGTPYMLRRWHWMIKPRAPYYIWQELTDLNFRLMFRRVDWDIETEEDVHRLLVMALPTYEQRALGLALERLEVNKEIEDRILKKLPAEDFICVTEAMIKGLKAKKAKNDITREMEYGIKVLQQRVDEAKAKRIYGSPTI